MLDSIHSLGNTVVLIIVSLNLVTLVSLIGGASSAYLPGGTKTRSAAIRLQLFRLCTWCLSIIVGIKLVLPPDFADSIISAWFIGQGFALQNILKSVINGIVLRYNETVCKAIIERDNECKYKIKLRDIDDTYTVEEANIAYVTLHHTPTSASIQLPKAGAVGKPHTRILLWTDIYSVDIIEL